MKIKQALTRKLGPLPAWAWLTVVLVGVFYWRSRSSSSTSGASSAATTAYDSGYSQGYGDASSLGGGGSIGGGSGSSNGGGSTGTTTGTGTGKKPPKKRPPRHKHKHRKPPRHHAGPPRVTAHTMSGFRTAATPVGRTSQLRALPVGSPSSPTPKPSSTPHAVPAGRPKAAVVSARHTFASATPAAPQEAPKQSSGASRLAARVRRGRK